MDVLKPYLALACVAFVVGFLGYWTLARTLAGGVVASEPSYQAPASVAGPDLDFDRGKRI